MTCNNPPWRPTFPLPVASVCWQSGPGVLSSSQHHLKQLAQQVEHDFHLQSAGAQDMKIKKYCFIRLSCFNFQTCDLFLFSSLAASLKFNYIDIPGSCPVQRSPPLLASLATFLDWRVVLEGISTWAKGSKSIILCLRFPTSSPTVQPLFAFSLRWILQSDFPRLNSRSLSFWFYSIFQVLCSLIHPNIYVWCCSALANHPVLQHQSQVLKTSAHKSHKGWLHQILCSRKHTSTLVLDMDLTSVLHRNRISSRRRKLRWFEGVIFCPVFLLSVAEAVCHDWTKTLWSHQLLIL